MCGFSGFLTTDSIVLNYADLVVSRIALAIQHRGPEDAGPRVGCLAGIALGFCRLSILDLSSAGHQSMHSASGHFVMTFNGGICNHADLRVWAKALLDGRSLEVERDFYQKPIRDKWLQHLTGSYDHTPSLWAVLMFQSWLESSSQKVVH